MRERAIIQTQADFDSWITAQQQPAAPPPPGPPTDGAQVFLQKGCTSCHTIQGVLAAQGKVGPNLTHFASRGTFAGSLFANNTQDLHAWLKDPPKAKPGSIMPNLGLNDQEIDALIAYLQSLK